MSRAYEGKQAALVAHPENREAAIDLFLGYCDICESDFTYEYNMSVEKYIFGGELPSQDAKIEA